MHLNIRKVKQSNNILNWKSRLQSIQKIIFLFLLIAFLFSFESILAQTTCPQMVESSDGSQISYEVHGTGEPTLVFVHGWSCDSRYWHKQIPIFSQNHRVVLIDLAGHGHSSMARKTYSMKAFGEDVKAVVEKVGGKNVILIGHSMGGPVIAEAAHLLPNRVIGLIGVDTFDNIEYPLGQEEFNGMMEPLKKDFKSGAHQFVKQMFRPNTDEQIQNWVLADMSAAPSSVALSTMEEVLMQYITGESTQIYKGLEIPVVSVNADLWPINYEANRRHMSSFEAIILKNADHFLMLNRPEDFNKALKQAIQSIIEE